MENKNEAYVYDTKNTLLGLLVGGLTGAVAMLLFAPQSGKQTRTKIRQETIQLRDRATTGIDKAVEQVRSVTNRITANVQDKAGELKQWGQDLAVENLDHLTKATKASKKAIQES